MLPALAVPNARHIQQLPNGQQVQLLNFDVSAAAPGVDRTQEQDDYAGAVAAVQGGPHPVGQHIWRRSVPLGHHGRGDINRWRLHDGNNNIIDVGALSHLCEDLS